jgi:hypothetical protein
MVTADLVIKITSKIIVIIAGIAILGNLSILYI